MHSSIYALRGSIVCRVHIVAPHSCARKHLVQSADGIFSKKRGLLMRPKEAFKYKIETLNHHYVQFFLPNLTAFILFKYNVISLKYDTFGIPDIETQVNNFNILLVGYSLSQNKGLT